MFGQLTEKAHFRISKGSADIVDNVCQRNCIEKRSDLQRMAYMAGMEIVLQQEKLASHEGDLMKLMAYYISDRARERME